MDALKDPMPDAELSLPAFNVVTGSYDPRSLKSTSLDFKTMSNRFRGRLLRAATAFLVTDAPSMLARFEDVGVELTPSTWAVAYADHVARCSGGDSNHAAHEWAAHGLSDVCHDYVKSALGVGVQILTDP
eukprot:jgi/Tetstr1/431888/TSEL_021377.t1